jgi:tetratricopeptide (TPR) repeat protein
MTQARFIRAEKDRAAAPSLFERKAFGPSYLVHVPTANHGGFSSYAALGITRAVPGFWGPATSDPRPLYEEICRVSLAFFANCLGDGRGRLEGRLAGLEAAPGRPAFKIEHKKGLAGPPPEAELIRLIIEKGIGQAKAAIGRARTDQPDLVLIDEAVLNWLGLHFLYWWGREDEAVGVFELNASLYPGSWRAHDALGEAYADRGLKEEAIRSYRRSLELNPENQNAKAALETLSPPAKKGPSGDPRK